MMTLNSFHCLQLHVTHANVVEWGSILQLTLTDHACSFKAPRGLAFIPVARSLHAATPCGASVCVHVHVLVFLLVCAVLMLCHDTSQLPTAAFSVAQHAPPVDHMYDSRSLIHMFNSEL